MCLVHNVYIEFYLTLCIKSDTMCCAFHLLVSLHVQRTTQHDMDLKLKRSNFCLQNNTIKLQVKLLCIWHSMYENHMIMWTCGPWLSRNLIQIQGAYIHVLSDQIRRTSITSQLQLEQLNIFTMAYQCCNAIYVVCNNKLCYAYAGIVLSSWT
jgi:hypothetical protein